MNNKEIKEFEKRMKNQRAEKGYSDSDVWNLFSWFLDIMPKMLTQLRDTHVSYPDIKVASDEEWTKELDRMIFLLTEMNEDTCSYVNKYQDDVDKAHYEFEKIYGLMGEKLADIIETEEDKENYKKRGVKRWYSYADDPNHPEYKELRIKWILEEQIKRNYMDRCREEFFNLFSKYFWNLWD